MRISRKIGISFFITFLLVILLGGISIYSLRHIYKGLNQVFSKDLPASRAAYEVAISSEELLSELTNFLITNNENFQVKYERAYGKLASSMDNLNKFIFSEEEKALFAGIKELAADIDEYARSLFDKRKKIKNTFEGVKKIEMDYSRKLNELFRFEEEKMLREEDILLIQAQHIPASELISGASEKFFELMENLTVFVTRPEQDRRESFMGNILSLEKDIRDYKNYYGYSLSEKERGLASDLLALSGELKELSASLVSLKSGVEDDREALFAGSKELGETIDKIIDIKKSGISSKLGVGAALTEDIPAIHNISEIEKDIAESWRITGNYLLSGVDLYKDLYYRIRQGVDKKIEDYDRHARLRDTDRFLDGIIESDKRILDSINTSIALAEKKKKATEDLFSLKEDIENRLGSLLRQKDSEIKKEDDPQKILSKNVPARWVIMRLQIDFSRVTRLVVDYLNTQDSRYKDTYSEVYFEIKKDLNKFIKYSYPEKDALFIKEIEPLIDGFNDLVLSIIETNDSLIRERGWNLVKLEEELKDRLNKAVEAEILQIEKNKKDLRNRIATVNSLIFFIIGGVALIAVFVIFYTTKSITEPIQKLYSGAGIIGSGDLDYRLDIKTGDEIQELADGFNDMAGELKELYTNLENKVKERTAQLAEANKALGVKNKELDDFTYIVSHDLKEPLRGVKAFTKLLVEDYSGKLDEEGRDYLKTISDSSVRMTKLIEDLLNLSRVGRIRNIEPDVDLNQVMSDVKKNLMYSLKEKNAELKVSDGFPKVTCDRIRISEVFSNLISNAIKYSKKDVKPVIEVGFSYKGDFYEFFVKDNGIGIEKEYFDKVFQIFQRLHAKGGEYEGTGAGLTIVKKIVQNHGGKIWVDSVAGKGSTFFFTLPKNVKES